MRFGSWLVRGSMGRMLVLFVLAGVGAGIVPSAYFECFIGQTVLAPGSKAYAQALSRPDSSGGQLDPDSAQNAIAYDQVAKKYGQVLRSARKWKIGAVLKFLGNRYWQSIAEGMESRAREVGLMIDINAGAAELDQAGQLAVMENMVAQGYDALLVAPQTDTSLDSVISKAREKGILVINVADAVSDKAQYYIGPSHFKAGVLAAGYLLDQMPSGGKVALIRGLQGVYSTRKSAFGFIETLPGDLFDIVAMPHCDWDLQSAFQASASILKEHPDLKAIYCQSDIMALGAARAVKMAGRAGDVLVLGTDGIDPAYSALEEGALAGTVDSYPYETGRAALEITLRILGKQRLPRVIFTPQEFIPHNSARISPANLNSSGGTGPYRDFIISNRPRRPLPGLFPAWMVLRRLLHDTGDFS